MTDTMVTMKSKREDVAPKKEWHKPRMIEVFYPRGEIKTIKDLHDWMNAVDLDGRLSDRDKRVLNRLARHLYLKTGRLDPSLGALALELSIPAEDNSARRMIRRSMAAAERLGWIERTERHGATGYWNRTNSYRLTVPKDVIPQGDSTVPLQMRVPQGDSTVRARGLHSPGEAPLQGDSRVPPTPKENSERKNSVKTLAPTARSESGASDDSEGGARNAPGTNSKSCAASPRVESGNQQIEISGKPPLAPAPVAADNGFAEFYRNCPKKRAPKDARKAYNKALKEGATQQELLAGIMRYAAERDGQDPKYTKYPATWLSKGCWDDEPSSSGRQPHSRNPGVAALLRMAGGDRE